MNKINFKNIYVSWLKDTVKKDLKISLIKKEQLGTLASCYQKIFNGEPFYENWTEKEARDVIEEYISKKATIWVPEIKGEAVGFLVATNNIPIDQQEFITPYEEDKIRYVEEVGIKKEYRGQNIASELVRRELIYSLINQKEYLGYRTNAIRYFSKKQYESFEQAVERIKKEDEIKRSKREKIEIPVFSLNQKQDFINQYIRLLKTRPDLDVSDSSKLFRGIGLNLEYSKNKDNYTWQQDPTGENNDRIFPIINLEKSGYVKTKYNNRGIR